MGSPIKEKENLQAHQVLLQWHKNKNFPHIKTLCPSCIHFTSSSSSLFFFFLPVQFMYFLNYFLFVLKNRSRCRGCISIAQDPTRIRQICLWDLQPRVSKRPEPSNAQEKAQGAMEATEKGDTRSEEESLCMPRAKLLTSWPLPCFRRSCWHKEAF